jgi:predicted nucleic-acid-binding protein
VVDLVIAGTVYVLESFYEAPRPAIALAIRSLLVMDSVVVVDAPLLLRALDVYENDGIDFADAYLVACAETTGTTRVASFDGSIDGVTTVRRIEP